jgi:hypothetical protein
MLGALGALIAAIGIIVMIWGGFQKYKAGRLLKAPFHPTGEVASKGEQVAGPKGAISTEGKVVCPQPLVSPCTGTPCLYYELKVVGTWKEGDATKSKDYVEEKKAAAFSLDDGSGPCRVEAGKGGDFDLEKTFDETKKEGFLADLKSAVGKGEPIVFGTYAFANPPMSKANKFQCTERILRVPERLYANGRVAEGGISSPSWTALILSAKSRDELLGSTARSARSCLLYGGIAAGVGVILGIVGAFL